ncbi:MAG: hypothetical protein CL470_06930 [Acidimicrobiaceae bacterium]|nr:hypothetical protein [Acidimicrobiaceae bacterium]
MNTGKGKNIVKNVILIKNLKNINPRKNVNTGKGKIGVKNVILMLSVNMKKGKIRVKNVILIKNLKNINPRKNVNTGKGKNIVRNVEEGGYVNHLGVKQSRNRNITKDIVCSVLCIYFPIRKYRGTTKQKKKMLLIE